MPDVRPAAWILGLALAARLALCLAAPVPPIEYDAAEYHAYAASLHQRGTYEGPAGARATRVPGYPLFLAAVYELAGPSPRAVQLAQCLFGALACFLLYWAALGVLEKRWAMAAGLAAALAYDMAWPATRLLTETWYGFLLCGGLAALLAPGKATDARAGLAGLAFGAAALTRPEALPFAGLSLAVMPKLLKGWRWRHSALSLALMAAMIGAWAGRNLAAVGKFTPTSTVSGWNFYLGLRLPAEQMGVAQGPRFDPGPGDELERDTRARYAYRELKGRLPLSTRLKAYAFNLVTVYYPFLPQYDAAYVFLLPFFAAGLWFARRRREFWPAALLVLGPSLVFAVLAGPVSRYRFGFTPCLILLAGLGAQSWSRRRVFWPAAAGWAAFNAGGWAFAPLLRDAALWVKTALW